jgi:tetrahydromethanopterin S-methyltransferase subunit B
VRWRLTIPESRIRSTPGDGTSAEQATNHLGCESVKTFEKIASREGIPKHYLSARAPATTAQNSTRGSQDAEATEGVLSALLTAGLRFLQPHHYGESALTAPPLRSRSLSRRLVPRG